MSSGHERAPEGAVLSAGDVRALTRLIEIDTAAPVETGSPSCLPEAQELIADHVAATVPWLDRRHVLVPPAGVLDDPSTPVVVRTAAERLGPEAFLRNQPSQVFVGGRSERHRRLMLNVHLDTVAGEVPVDVRDGVIGGRGAVDAKGPLIAVLAGLRLAFDADPTVLDDLGVVVQVVAGEEGGAMGTFGTRLLVEQGWTGALNLFCEPTGGRYLDHVTAAMTPRVTVDGIGSIDDRPEGGHNATVALAHLVCEMAAHLEPLVEEHGGTLCVGGVCTGTMHNRVYGGGSAVFNIAYPSHEVGERLAAAVEEAFLRGRETFAGRWSDSRLFGRTAADVEEIVSLTWEKRGLPALANRSDPIEAILSAAFFTRWPSEEPGFTCDAIWVPPDHGYTAVCGPGDLGANRAHADGEFICLEQLDRFAAGVAILIQRFREHVSSIEEPASR